MTTSAFHADLVARAVAWLKGAGGCEIALSEMGGGLCFAHSLKIVESKLAEVEK